MLAEVTGGRSRTRSAREGFGKPVPRRKDTRPLVGTGCYSDDVNLPGQSHSASCVVRSPHVLALICRIDTAAALATPVLGPAIEARRAYGLVAP